MARPVPPSLSPAPVAQRKTMNVARTLSIALLLSLSGLVLVTPAEAQVPPLVCNSLADVDAGVQEECRTQVASISQQLGEAQNTALGPVQDALACDTTASCGAAANAFLDGSFEAPATQVNGFWRPVSLDFFMWERAAPADRHTDGQNGVVFLSVPAVNAETDSMYDTRGVAGARVNRTTPFLVSDIGLIRYDLLVSEAVTTNHYISFDIDGDGIVGGCFAAVAVPMKANALWQSVASTPSTLYNVNKWRNCRVEDEAVPASWGPGTSGTANTMTLEQIQQELPAGTQVFSSSIQVYKSGSDGVALPVFGDNFIMQPRSAAQQPACASELPNIGSGFGGCQIDMPDQVRDLTGICAIHIQKAGASGSDFVRYYLYSDLDGDGVTDLQEINGEGNGDPTTDPECQGNADSDGDGVSDADEADNGTDPGNPDTDGDFLTDCQETGYVADSPDGGVNDADACDGIGSYHTSPTDADSDGDGAFDGIEVLVESNPTDAGESPRDTAVSTIINALDGVDLPGVSDLDGDNRTDAQEAEDGTDPTLADTDGDGLNDCQETGFVARGTGANNPTEPTRVNVWDAYPATSPWVTGEGNADGRTCAEGLKTYFTNATLADSDGDTVSDGDEAIGRYATTACSGLGPAYQVSDPRDFWGLVAAMRAVPFVGTMLSDLVMPALADAGYMCTNLPSNPTAVDTDADDLDDNQELGDGTFVLNAEEYPSSPIDPDSDDDILPDPVEVARGIALFEEPGNSADGLLGIVDPDSDNDSFTDCQETGPVARGTGINNPAVDFTPGSVYLTAKDLAPEIPCGALQTYYTSPMSSDSDGDTFGDTAEINGRQVLDPIDGVTVLHAAITTNPTTIDTDGDTYSDCGEFGYRAGSYWDDASNSDRSEEAELYNSAPSAQNYPCASPQLWFTSPALRDSDHDGLSDELEIPGIGARVGGRQSTAYGNPTVADSDADGLLECQESVVGGPNVLVPGGEISSTHCFDGSFPTVDLGLVFPTIPRDDDSDKDGDKDGAEVTGYEGSETPTNPTDFSILIGSRDYDGDGLANCQETGYIAYGTGDNTAPANDGIRTDGMDKGGATRTCTDASADALTRYFTNSHSNDSDNDRNFDSNELAGRGRDAGVNGAGGTAVSVSNPSAFDTDGDGLQDCQETNNGVPYTFMDNPNTIANNTDALTIGFLTSSPLCPDRDGNGSEVPLWAYSSHAKDNDTDDDGLQDLGEVYAYTDPRNVDTDADALSDCQEAYRLHVGSPAIPESTNWGNGYEFEQFQNQLIVPPAVDPLVAVGVCPVIDGMVGEGNAYATTPINADSDNDQTPDGAEVSAEPATNPTLADASTSPADPVCDMTDMSDGDGPACQELVDGAVGPIVGSIRYPDPNMLTDPGCDFLDPLSWVGNGAPSAGGEGEPTIVWGDAGWDGEGCNDGGVASPELPNPSVGNLQAFYNATGVDVRDPLDIDEDGVTAESNGQPDAQEARVMVLDPHGELQTLLDVGISNGDGAGSVSSDRNPMLNDAMGDGFTIYVREPATASLRGTVTVVSGDSALVIIETRGVSWQTVCIQDGTVFGPYAGRYSGSCTGGALGADTDGDSFPDVVEQGFDGIFGGDTEGDADQTPLTTLQAIGDDLVGAFTDLADEACAEQPETVGGLPNPAFTLCEAVAGGGDPTEVIAQVEEQLACLTNPECTPTPEPCVAPIPVVCEGPTPTPPPNCEETPEEDAFPDCLPAADAEGIAGMLTGVLLDTLCGNDPALDAELPCEDTPCEGDECPCEGDGCPPPPPCDPETDPTCEADPVGLVSGAVCSANPEAPICGEGVDPTDFPPCSQPRGDFEAVRICRDDSEGFATSVTNGATGDSGGLVLEVGNLKFQV